MLRKYYELGFSVIPVNGKRTALGVSAHTRWANERQPESLIDSYEKFQSTGWAIVTGKVSNVVAIDIDSESKDILTACPPSAYRKRGRRGETRFFQWSEEFDAKRKIVRKNKGDPETGKADEGIEILCAGAYTVMPPSIHPDTGKPYIFNGLPLEYASDLPLLTYDDLAPVIALIEATNDYGAKTTTELSGVYTSPPDEKRCPHGSQDRLKALCASLIEQLKPIDQAVNDLLKYDEQHHTPITYFGDPSRSDFKGDAYTSAVAFYSSMLLSINRKRKRAGLAPQVPSQAKSVDISSITIGNKEKKVAAFPRSSGLIYTIQQTVLRVSRSRQDELALGASIAICSALTSNRFHIEGRPAITHQYIMNVARSGQGKGAGFTVANKLLGPGQLENYNLIGMRNYSSIASFVNGLPTQRSRLDMVDEFGTVIKGLSQGSDIKKELEGLLCELYTNSGDYWNGHTTKTDGRQGACYAPAVTVYANIQEDTLTSSASKSQIDSGLLSRFLYFSANKRAEFNTGYTFTLDIEAIASECKRIFPFYKLEAVMPDGTVIADAGKIEPHRDALVYGVGVNNYRYEIDESLHKSEQDLEESGDVSGAIFLSRRLQIAERIAITNAVCCGRREINKDDLDFGLSVVTAAMQRAELYLKTIGGESRFEKKANWARKFLARKGGKAQHTPMFRSSNIDKPEFKRLIESLKESGELVEYKDSVTGGIWYAAQ